MLKRAMPDPARAVSPHESETVEHTSRQQGGSMNAVVGNFCIACLGKQLYRATVSRDGQWGSKRIKCRVCGQGEDDGRNQDSEVRELVQGEHAAGPSSGSGRQVRSEQGCMAGRMGGTGTAEAGNSGCVQCGVVAHVVKANNSMTGKD